MIVYVDMLLVYCNFEVFCNTCLDLSIPNFTHFTKEIFLSREDLVLGCTYKYIGNSVSKILIVRYMQMQKHLINNHNNEYSSSTLCYHLIDNKSHYN